MDTVLTATDVPGSQPQQLSNPNLRPRADEAGGCPSQGSGEGSEGGGPCSWERVPRVHTGPGLGRCPHGTVFRPSEMFRHRALMAWGRSSARHGAAISLPRGETLPSSPVQRREQTPCKSFPAPPPPTPPRGGRGRSTEPTSFSCQRAPSPGRTLTSQPPEFSRQRAV